MSLEPVVIPPEDEINLIDLLIVLAKNKKMILGVTFVGALLSIGISLRLPNIYTATAKILPPQSSQSSSVNTVMLAQLGGLAGGMGGALGLKDPNSLYIAMLKSRNIMEKIVLHFDLKTIYKTETLSETIAMLEKRSSISSGKDSIISVEVEDTDPQRVALMANIYVEELNKLMQTLALTEASQRRQFFETQMKPSKDRLTNAEITLDKTPNTSLRYLDALRSLKFEESIYQVLVKQYEVAKLDEAKNAPLIQIMDKAIVPENKSKPKRSILAIIGTLVAFFLAVIWVFVRDALTRANQQPGKENKMKVLRNTLKWKPM
jgi:uncharacterized protein involved in exopolysaccharide biosynthesis